MQVSRGRLPEAREEVEKTLCQLLTLRLFKSWNIFATRIFYFSRAQGQPQEEDFRITLECPWRVEQDGRVIVGSEDYGVRAEDNHDPTWDRADAQWGHLQDQKLQEMLGEERDGAILNLRLSLIVGSVHVDEVGGFRVGFSEGYTLAVFPASRAEMAWLFSRPGGGNLALQGGNISSSLTEA